VTIDSYDENLLAQLGSLPKPKQIARELVVAEIRRRLRTDPDARRPPESGGGRPPFECPSEGV
jgi:hypothetical protein